MDTFQDRMLAGLRKRHEDRIRQHAERIAKHTGYVLARLDQGSAGTGSVGHYAAGIAADAHEIISRVAALDAIGETTGILVPAPSPGESVYLPAGVCVTCGNPVPGGGHREDCTGLVSAPAASQSPELHDGPPQ